MLKNEYSDHQHHKKKTKPKTNKKHKYINYKNVLNFFINYFFSPFLLSENLHESDRKIQ